MKKVFLLVFIGLLLTASLWSVTYDPLTMITAIPSEETITDLAFYAGYLYICSHDTLYIYDITGGSLVLKGTSPFPHSEASPRLYLWHDELILYRYVNEIDHALIFYSLHHPLQPEVIYTLIPSQEGLPPLTGGFDKDRLSGCTVTKDYLFCPACWFCMGYPPPGGDHPFGPPTKFFAMDAFFSNALYLPTMESVAIWPSTPYCGCGTGEYCDYTYDGAQIRYYRGDLLFLTDWEIYSFPYILLDEARKYQIDSIYPCEMVETGCSDSCGLVNSFLYKRWLFADWWAWNAYYMMQGFLSSNIHSRIPNQDADIYGNLNVQEMTVHEDWFFATGYDWSWDEDWPDRQFGIVNYDASHMVSDEDPKIITGLNEVEQGPLGLIVLNDILYVAAEANLYLFDTPRHDTQRPTGTVNVKEEGTALHFYGTAMDDDGIKAVTLRFDDAYATSKTFEEIDYYARDNDTHPIPLNTPQRWDISVEAGSLAPGTYTVRVIAEDWEGTFSIIGEREVTITTGTTKPKKREREERRKEER